MVAMVLRNDSESAAVSGLYRYHPGILIYYGFFSHWDGMDRKWDGMLGFEFFFITLPILLGNR